MPCGGVGVIAAHVKLVPFLLTDTIEFQVLAKEFRKLNHEGLGGFFGRSMPS